MTVITNSLTKIRPLLTNSDEYSDLPQWVADAARSSERAEAKLRARRNPIADRDADLEAEARRKLIEENRGQSSMQSPSPQSAANSTMHQASILPTSKSVAHNGFLAKMDKTLDSMHSLEKRVSQLISYEDSNKITTVTATSVLAIAAGLIARRFGLVRL